MEKRDRNAIPDNDFPNSFMKYRTHTYLVGEPVLTDFTTWENQSRFPHILIATKFPSIPCVALTIIIKSNTKDEIR